MNEYYTVSADKVHSNLFTITTKPAKKSVWVFDPAFIEKKMDLIINETKAIHEE